MANTLKVWLNAFIPGDIPGLTFVVSNGVHAGKTAIRGPIPGISDCFLTDQRSFDSNPGASSRMHSEIEIDLTVPSIIRQIHRCDPTIEIDCEDGDEECNQSGNTNRMQFRNFQSSGSLIQIDLIGAASNPCFTGAPDIDYQGKLEIRVDSSKTSVTISFTGFVEPFPSFEMYAQLDNLSQQVIFRKSPNPGSSPGDLFGNANQPIDVTVTL